MGQECHTLRSITEPVYPINAVYVTAVTNVADCSTVRCYVAEAELSNSSLNNFTPVCKFVT